MKLVVNTSLWTEDYLKAITTLLKMANFHVDETYELVGDEEGDLAIYPNEDNASVQTWILETLRDGDVI